MQARLRLRRACICTHACGGPLSGPHLARRVCHTEWACRLPALRRGVAAAVPWIGRRPHRRRTNQQRQQHHYQQREKHPIASTHFQHAPAAVCIATPQFHRFLHSIVRRCASDMLGRGPAAPLVQRAAVVAVAIAYSDADDAAASCKPLRRAAFETGASLRLQLRPAVALQTMPGTPELAAGASDAAAHASAVAAQAPAAAAAVPAAIESGIAEAAAAGARPRDGGDVCTYATGTDRKDGGGCGHAQMGIIPASAAGSAAAAAASAAAAADVAAASATASGCAEEAVGGTERQRR
eukprot:364503-Chlamydomonas_euryale.AAC.14